MNDIINQFLQNIWGNGQHSLCYRLPESPFMVQGLHETPESLILSARALPGGADIWFGVQPLQGVSAGRGTAADVEEVNWLAADFDYADEVHKLASLPSEDELFNRLRLLPNKARPRYLVHSGHGFHAYWPLVEPINPRDIPEHQDRMERFWLWLEGLGLFNDRKDLASVLRLPGTTNWKDVDTPLPVFLEEFADSYTPAVDLLDIELPERQMRQGPTTGGSRIGRRQRDSLFSQHAPPAFQPFAMFGKLTCAEEGERNLALKDAAFLLGREFSEGRVDNEDATDMAIHLSVIAEWIGLDDCEIWPTIESGIARGRDAG